MPSGLFTFANWRKKKTARWWKWHIKLLISLFKLRIHFLLRWIQLSIRTFNSISMCSYHTNYTVSQKSQQITICLSQIYDNVNCPLNQQTFKCMACVGLVVLHFGSRVRVIYDLFEIPDCERNNLTFERSKLFTIGKFSYR